MSNDDNTEQLQTEAEDHQAKNSDILPPDFTLDNRTKKGIMLAGLILCGMFFPTVSMFLLAVACILVVSGQASKQVEGFLKTIPFGDHFMNAISRIEKILS